MGVWDKKIPWRFVLLLTGALAQKVNYPKPICAVKGSTVTIPCTFNSQSPFVDSRRRRVWLRVVRVVWCVDHLICQGQTPSVYDSTSTKNNPRFRYLGDLTGNCTLQIMNIQLADGKTYRFRMEVNHTEGHFTEQSGVNITVIDGIRMNIRRGQEMKGGGEVMLECTKHCSFHQLDIDWSRDGHALQESGPALRLRPLTAADSGNYSCALRNNQKTRSEPYSLYVPADKGEFPHLPVVVGVVVAALALISALIIFIIFFRRKQAAAAEKRQAGDVTVQETLENTYSNILRPADVDQEEAGAAVEEVSYASIHFKHKTSSRPPDNELSQGDEATIYTSVARLQ